jgi:hypothetical protein
MGAQPGGFGVMGAQPGGFGVMGAQEDLEATEAWVLEAWVG